MHLYNFINSMRAPTSSKFQQNRHIDRTVDANNFNSIYIPKDRTVEATHFYKSKKRFLQQKGSLDPHVHLNKQKKFELAMTQIQQSIKSNNQINQNLLGMIKEVRVIPVFTNNTLTQFDQSRYPLQENEKVDVIKEHVFPTKNYYNYICEMQTKKELYKQVDKARQSLEGQIEKYEDQYKASPAQRQTKELSIIKSSEEGSVHQNMQPEISVIKGPYMSKFNPYSWGNSKRPPIQPQKMDPIHINYSTYGTKSFALKEYQKGSSDAYF